MVVSLLQEILNHYPSLTPAERRVADLMLGQPQEITGMTLEEIASRTGVSQATASRFYRRLSAGGYPLFKVQLAQQLGEQHARSDGQAGLALGGDGRLPVGEPEALLRRAVEQTRSSLENAYQAISLLNPDAMQQAVEAILRAGSIVACGFHLSGAVAWRLAHLLRISGFAARDERDSYEGAYWMDLLKAGDLVIVVSYRGDVPQLFDALARARARGVTIMAITNEARSGLVELSDCVVLSHAPAARTNDEYVAGDAMFVQIAVVRTLWFAATAAAERKTRSPEP